jgi:hypothetical protein
MNRPLTPSRLDGLPTTRWSEIAPGLWMGGSPELGEPTSELPFDAVVTLYAFAPPASWLVEELRYGFFDGPMDLVDVPRVLRTSAWAYERWQAGDRVLIRCQAGLNRSGLVTALVLMAGGLSAAHAIDVIRERRSSYALCNRSFEAWLLEQDSTVPTVKSQSTSDDDKTSGPLWSNVPDATLIGP